LHHTPAGTLAEATSQTPGMVRAEAISGRRGGAQGIWMGATTVAPGSVSGDHHHGESETAIFVVSGHPNFVYLDESGSERRIEAAPGDYVYVPPWTPHREENPSPAEDAVVVLARTTQEAIVVNLTGLGNAPAAS
jgi:uncharacterized RmlC-like cupin family protein